MKLISSIAWTLLIAGISTFFSLIGAVILGILDKKRENLTFQQFEKNSNVSSVKLLGFCADRIPHSAVFLGVRVTAPVPFV